MKSEKEDCAPYKSIQHFLSYQFDQPRGLVVRAPDY